MNEQDSNPVNFSDLNRDQQTEYALVRAVEALSATCYLMGKLGDAQDQIELSRQLIEAMKQKDFEALAGYCATMTQSVFDAVSPEESKAH